MFEFVSKSPNDTLKLGKILARKISQGYLVFFEGELGAGKTALIKAICKYLGVKKVVSSPTFVLEKIYRAKKFNVHHLDLYRIATPAEAAALNMEEQLAANNVCFIEWPDAARSILQPPDIEIKIEKTGETERRFFVYEHLNSNQ